MTSHGGDVAVEPAPGAGSVFTIWLPVATDTVMTRILLVEDEPIIASALQYDLTLEGYDVTVVGDGVVASARAPASRTT